MFKHLLLPTDGSPRSARAVTSGVALAKSTGARVTGLFVAPPATPLVFEHFVPVRYMTPDDHAELIEHEAQRAFSVLGRRIEEPDQLRAHTHFGWPERWLLRQLTEPFARVCHARIGIVSPIESGGCASARGILPFRFAGQAKSASF